MKRVARWVLIGISVLGLITLVAWAYSYNFPMTPQASDEWSRGRVIGESSVSLPVAMQPAPDGGMLLVWPNVDGDLEISRIDVDGDVLLDRVLLVGQGAARSPQLRIGPDGVLHLLWRAERQYRSSIYYMTLEADGTPIGHALPLSIPENDAQGVPRLLLDLQGRLHALWGDEQGIQWAVLSSAGELLAGPTLLVGDARFPAAQLDEQGRIRLAWQQSVGSNTREIYYAALNPESGELIESERMTMIYLRTGQRVDGPELGLDPETGYVIWVVDDSRDRVSRAWYAYFPLQVPRQKRIKPLHLEVGVNPMRIYPLEGQRTPLLVAMSETLFTSEGLAEFQIAVLAVVGDQTPDYEVWGLAQIKSEGRRAARLAAASDRVGGQHLPLLGWQAEHIVTASPRRSISPVLATDDGANLHLVWLEAGGFGDYQVIYASTAPEIRRSYNALTLWDVADAFLGSVVQLSVIVITMTPMFALWAAFPLAALLVFHVLTGEEGLETIRSWVVLVVVLAAEVALTAVFPPSRGLPWPSLRWIAPLATAALAVVVTVLVLRRRGDSLLFTAFFLFTTVHSLLQLAFYALA